jgi:signal transduction histidine kinase
LHPGIEVPEPTRDSLVRIVREAVSNAARHGAAEVIELELHGPHPLVLRVNDDGRGFDVAAVNGSGFGLTSMRERAEHLGGSLTLSSRPGHGTAVEIRIP